MDTVVLSRQEYQDMVDALDHAVAMRQVAAGVLETVSESDVDAYLAAPTPLAFWRRHRGFTAARVAAEAGLSEAALARMEAGEQEGSVRVLARVARLLRVRMEDLVADE